MSEPLWTPSDERVGRSNMTAFRVFVNKLYEEELKDYDQLFQWSIANRVAFWSSIWDFFRVLSSKTWDDAVLDPQKMPGTRWFTGSQLNFAENLLAYSDDRPALIFKGEQNPPVQMTYAELHTEVAWVAAALRALGVEKGDRVAGFLPNMIESVVAMLATASIGALWSSTSPDFGIKGVLDRFGQIEPKVLFCANGYHYGGKTFDSLERVGGILEQLPSIQQVVVVPYTEFAPDISALPKSVLYGDFKGYDDQPPELVFEQLPFDHPLYVMYSSGTTGVPKCIVHGAGGTLLQHCKELGLHTDITREDVVFYFTTCGWMMWNWLVSSLALGATVLLYDGSPFHPDPGVLWRLAEEQGITVFGTSAKYLAALEKSDYKPAESVDLSALKTICSTGSPLSAESFEYAYRDIKQDLCLSSISGGTDIVSCFALGSPTLPVYRSELQCRGLGMAVEAWDDDGNPVIGQQGELVCTASFPSMPVEFWNDPDGAKYRGAYFETYPGVWHHGDFIEVTEHGGVIMYGRSDATLNPGGVRIGTAEIYRQVEGMDEILDSLVIGQDWEDDVRVILFVKLVAGLTLDDALIDKIRKTIRTNTTPRHVPAKILETADIPYTISGKKVELAVRNVIHHRPVKNRDALANPESLELYADLDELKS